MEKWTRRTFFLATLVGGVAASTKGLLGAPPGTKATFAADALRQARAGGKGARPLIVSAANGIHYLDAGMAVLKGGGDTLDAVLAVVTKVEDDPNDDSVGYGGLPNEDGVVQLDACVMHGPTGRCGAVGAIEKIKNPSLVAKIMMEKDQPHFHRGSRSGKIRG